MHNYWSTCHFLSGQNEFQENLGNSDSREPLSWIHIGAKIFRKCYSDLDLIHFFANRVSYVINQFKFTSRTPFLGGFQIHFFQGTFVRQNNFAFSSIATTSCLPPLSVFLKTRYSSGSLLLHPKTKCQSNTNTIRNISMQCEKTRWLFVWIMVDAFISRCYKVTKLFYYHNRIERLVRPWAIFNCCTYVKSLWYDSHFKYNDDKNLCVYLRPCVYFQIRNTFLLYIGCNYWMILLAQKGHPTTTNLSGHLNWLYNINNFKIISMELHSLTAIQNESCFVTSNLLGCSRTYARKKHKTIFYAAFCKKKWSCSGNTISKNVVVMRPQ